MTDTYNGWANYETWNVALYIQNEYSIYSLAREWVEHEHGEANVADYWRFSHTLRELAVTAPRMAWHGTTHHLI